MTPVLETISSVCYGKYIHSKSANKVWNDWVRFTFIHVYVYLLEALCFSLTDWERTLYMEFIPV